MPFQNFDLSDLPHLKVMWGKSRPAQKPIKFYCKKIFFFFLVKITENDIHAKFYSLIQKT